MESEQTDSLESKPPSGGNKRLYLKHGSREWQLLEGLRGEQKFETKPDKYEGQMMKRRKWPLKGWHKVRGWEDGWAHGEMCVFGGCLGRSCDHVAGFNVIRLMETWVK